MAPRYELAVGLRRGHKTTKIDSVSKPGKELTAKIEKLRQSRIKGVSKILFSRITYYPNKIVTFLTPYLQFFYQPTLNLYKSG